MAFLQKNGTQWIDATEHIFPRVTIDDFASDPKKIQKRPDLKEFGAFTYNLPQKGTKITVEFELVWYEWNNTDRTEAEAVRLLEPITYKTIEFNWLKDERRFKPAKKEKR